MSDIPTHSEPLLASLLYREADIAGLSFATTDELEPLPGLSDQKRASEAFGFGTAINHRGFNIIAIGTGGARLQASIRDLLDAAARNRPDPPDWVYVNNFTTPHRPVAINLPGGRAPALQATVHDLVAEIRIALPAVFESEDYQKRRAAVEQSFQGRQESAFASLNARARERSIAILRTPMGFAMAPLRDGKVVPPQEWAEWPEAEQQAVRNAIKGLEKELEETLRSIPRLEKEQRTAIHVLDRETAIVALATPFQEARAAFADLPAIVAYLDAVHTDMLDNLGLFLAQEAAAQVPAALRMGEVFDRYEVNVLVTQAGDPSGAPVIDEPHPTLGNLLGRIEYVQMQGALVTNFRLIKAGALHRANGGTLLLDLRSLLAEPFSWTALKRALLRQQIAIEDVARFIGLTTTVSLEPDPIPLDIKIVLIGDRALYYLLAVLDPELEQHFKVLADFDDDVDRCPESEAMLARLVAAIVARDRLLPLDCAAVARTIEHAARLAADAGKLTLEAEKLHDLLAEAGHWATAAGRAVATRDDIETAIAQQRRRASRLREASQDMMLRGVAMVDTQGSAVGQINGLSVMALGGTMFGRPSRITCRVRPGSGRIIDIEREVKLGGPLHSKGVLILAGFLAGRYALDAPISLSASLVFEQSYGGVEGDSASSAELYALLSAIAGQPLRQDLAVTGSVNQHGAVQAIGGANEKIEGFFDLCDARGLTGTQGVLIPASNVQHLMLRADVVSACAAGRFAVYPFATIDEGLALLTGLPAGERDADGAFPEGSLNRIVEDRLARFAAAARRHDGKGGDNHDGDGDEP